MITAVSFIGIVFIILGFYVYNYKEAEIEISFIRGIMVGFSHTAPELDEVKTHYVDIYLGVIIISLIWNE